MNEHVKELCREISFANGYAVVPSCVVGPGEQGCDRARAVIVHDEMTIEINAEGHSLASLKRAIRERVSPDVLFTDEPVVEEAEDETGEENELQLGTPDDGISQTNPHDRGEG